MHPSLKAMIEHGLAPLQCGVLLTSTGRFAERLMEAFPELYSEDINDLRFPVSVIRAAAACRDLRHFDLKNIKEKNTELDWKNAVDFYGIPIAFEWCNQPGGMGSNRIPAEIWKQIEGKSLRGGMMVTYNDEWYVTVWIGGIVLSNTPKPGEVLESDEGIVIAVVHSRHIDLDS